MDTAQPDPFDNLWTPAQRAEGREHCRAEARAVAMSGIEHLTPERFEADRWAEYVDSIVADWLAAHDAMMERAARIMRAPEAAGREHLARHLVRKTAHSAQAAILILRGASLDVLPLPVGGEREARVASMRRAATLEASA